MYVYCCSNRWPLFVIVFVCVTLFLRKGYAEEDFLANKFGRLFSMEPASAYHHSSLWQWQVPILHFPGKKYWPKKRMACTCLFYAGSSFQLWVELYSDRRVQLPTDGLSLPLLITGLAYLILKLIKYQTSWLKEEESLIKANLKPAAPFFQIPVLFHRH